MKKVIIHLFMLFVVINLVGCSSNKTKPEDTQKKIDDAKWNLEYKVEENAEQKSITLIVSDESEFSFSLYKDKMNAPIYMNTDSDRYYYLQHEGRKDFAMLTSLTTDITNVSCFRYNITDQKQSDTSKEGACDEESINKFMNIRDERDKILSVSNITMADLETWASWYFSNQK